MNSPEEIPEKIVNVPNSITAARWMAMVWAIVDVILHGPNMTAASIYAVASLCDGLDGLAARRLNQKTEFGKKFDPIVDASSFLLAIGTLAAITSSEAERVLYITMVATQTLYMGQLSHRWKKLGEQKKELWPSIIGKTKTAVMMLSLVKLLGGENFLQSLYKWIQDQWYAITTPANIELYDAQLHTAALWGMGIWLLGTLWCWNTYNKAANKILKG